MYVGLMDRKNIKFFTFKLQITSGIMCSHDIQQLEYFANKNELIAVGTHDMSVWTLDGNVTRGDLIIQPTLRLSIHPKLREGDWIDMAFILHERKQIWIVVNTSIMIYHYENGTYLNTIKHVTARKISCIAHHAEYQYILVGSVDGTIKVINIVNASVHEFVSHSKSVVSISVFPEGPLFISCSADQTIRLFNLKYFKEICSVHLKEKPIHMGLIDDVYLYVRTRSNLQIWATNQFNVNFTTMR
jgi:WD40 repeat protein